MHCKQDTALFVIRTNHCCHYLHGDLDTKAVSFPAGFRPPTYPDASVGDCSCGTPSKNQPLVRSRYRPDRNSTIYVAFLLRAPLVRSRGIHLCTHTRSNRWRDQILEDHCPRQRRSASAAEPNTPNGAERADCGCCGRAEGEQKGTRWGLISFSYIK